VLGEQVKAMDNQRTPNVQLNVAGEKRARKSGCEHEASQKRVPYAIVGFPKDGGTPCAASDYGAFQFQHFALNVINFDEPLLPSYRRLSLSRSLSL
jgi:hypothetical protein